MKDKVIGGLRSIILAFIIAYITSLFMDVNIIEQAQSILIYYLVFAVSEANIFND